MYPKPYLLFDAGGTIVFPDQSFLIEQAQQHKVSLTDKQLFDGYYHLIHKLDQKYKRHQNPKPWPRGYAYALFETLGMSSLDADAIADAFNDRHKEKNLWAFTFPRVEETLSELKRQGYRMSVISNSDGRTEDVLREVKLLRYFDRIFDSESLGLEKPDPAIFEAALERLNLKPADALYIGDMFHVDALGANKAGVGGIHIDPLGLYTDRPGVHLDDVNCLPDWLAQHIVHASPFEYLLTRTFRLMPHLSLKNKIYYLSRLVMDDFTRRSGRNRWLPVKDRVFPGRWSKILKTLRHSN